MPRSLVKGDKVPKASSNKVDIGGGGAGGGGGGNNNKKGSCSPFALIPLFVSS